MGSCHAQPSLTNEGTEDLSTVNGPMETSSGSYNLTDTSLKCPGSSSGF